MLIVPGLKHEALDPKVNVSGFRNDLKIRLMAFMRTSRHVDSRQATFEEKCVRCIDRDGAERSPADEKTEDKLNWQLTVCD